MKIFVRRVVCPDQTTVTLAYVKDSTRIIDVKRMVQREWQIAPEHQRLIFSCWELSDNHKTPYTPNSRGLQDYR